MTNCLITGGLGFIGSNFANRVVDMFNQVVILDKMSYSSSKKYIKSSNIQIIVGDISNRELIKYILDKYDINLIVNFAAESHVDNSFYNSLNFTENNVVGTHILMETAKIYNEETGSLKKFIHISTDEVYGEVRDNIARHEDDVLRATNPYAATKAAAEMIALSYYHSYNFPVIITRSNNIYGIHQHEEKVIPSFITKSLKGEKLNIQGRGEAKRSFLHVEDLNNALLIIIDKGEIGQRYNIGSSCEYTVKELADIILSLFELPSTYINYIEDRHFNDIRYHICTKKIEALGWKQQKNDFIEELKVLIEWYKQYY